MTHIGRRYGRLIQMSYATRDMDAAIVHAETQLGITGLRRSESEIEVLSYGETRRLGVKSAIANIGTPAACASSRSSSRSRASPKSTRTRRTCRRRSSPSTT